MNYKAQRYVSTLLSLLNAIGVVLTFVAVSKEAPRAQKEMKSLPKDAKKITKVKTFVKNYKLSLISATATIASGLGSKIFSNKAEASLLATVGMLDAGLHKYKDKIKKKFGIDADKSIIKEILKDDFEKPEDEAQPGEKLYCMENIGYFYAKPEKVMSAYVKLNRDMCDNDSYDGYYSPGIFTIGEFLTLAQARPLSKNLTESKLNFGWSYDYLSEGFNNVWVHMDIEEPDEDGASLIYFYEQPIWNPAEWYDYHYGYLKPELYFEKADMGRIDLESYSYQINQTEQEKK